MTVAEVTMVLVAQARPSGCESQESIGRSIVRSSDLDDEPRAQEGQRRGMMDAYEDRRGPPRCATT
eukprot:7272370-Prymnesium_polylepis.1